MQTAIDTTKAALPNISYMNSVGHYVQHFGGGDKGGFELIAFLQQLSKSFGHRLFLGEEYMDALAFTRFQRPQLYVSVSQGFVLGCCYVFPQISRQHFQVGHKVRH